MAKKEKSSPWQPLVRYFLAGVFAVLPLVITVLAVTWVISFMNNLVGPETWLGDLLSRLGLNFVQNANVAYVLGWIGVLAGIFVLGFLVESGMKRLYGRVTEAVFKRVPLVGKVYDASKQLVDMLDAQGDDKLKGMSVVFCSFGEKAVPVYWRCSPRRRRFPSTIASTMSCWFHNRRSRLAADCCLCPLNRLNVWICPSIHLCQSTCRWE